jgi:hypothetical protein
MIYIGLSNVLFLLRLGTTRNAERRLLYFFLLLLLFVFSAFRYQVGCDWTGYHHQYLVVNNVNWSSITEIRDPIWWAILGWIRYMEWPYVTVNIFSSAVFFLGVHVLARRQPDPLGFLALLFPILIINMPMSGIRQGVAIGLLCIAFAAFIDRRTSRVAFWVAVAAGFHASALVFMLLLPLTLGRFTTRRLLLSAALMVPGAFLLTTGELADLAMDRYVDSDVEALGAAFRVGFLSLSSLYFFMFLRRNWQQTSPQDYGLATIGAIMMMLAFILIPLSTVIGDRFGYYLIPIQAMIFARIPYLQIRTNAKLLAALPYIGLLFLFSVWALESQHFQECYIPYQTWIFGFPYGDTSGF